MSTSLIYEALNTNENEIRLLDLLPAKDGAEDEIVCVLRTASLDAHEPYEALSYHWGEKISSLPISIKYGSNETQLIVQENLYQALLHLRGSVATLWADAICINQINNDEKSQQVQQMARIYREAEKVRVWLGVAENDSDRAISCLIGLFAVWGVASLSSPAPDFEDCLLATLQKIDKRTSETARIDLVAVDALLSRAWWSRIWVVQEVTLAKEVLFHCGHRVVVDKTFAISIYVLSASKRKLSTNYFGTERVNNSLMTWYPNRRSYFIRYQLENRDRVDQSLRALLELGCISGSGSNTRMEATDPRDFIYGLAGICNDWDTLGIVVDYTKTCEQLYLEVASAMLHNDITILSLAQAGKSTTSWVPDWSSQIILPLQTRHSNPTFYRPQILKTIPGSQPLKTSCKYFSASRSEARRTKIVFKQDLLAETSMIISVIRLDKVENTSQPWSRTLLLNIPYENEMQYIKSVFRLANSDMRKYQGFEAVVEAVFRTIVTDRERLANDPTVLRCRTRKQFWDSIRQIYQQWLKTRSFEDKKLLLQDIVRTKDSNYFTSLGEYNDGRMPFKTAQGWIGLGPQSVIKGDIIVIILGADVPYILRIGEEGKYRLVGEAYVHGVMDGEAMEMGLPVEEIDLY